MKSEVLYIDDEASISEDNFLTGNSLFELAKNIIANKNSKVILINIHFCFSPKDAPEKYDNLQNCAGIDLLKMLRLQGEKRHSILFSPLKINELLRLSPGNLIVTSEGVSCVHSYHELKNLDWDNLSNKRAISPFPKEFYKVNFQMPEDERHNWANWWGIRQLCNVHRLIDAQMNIKNDLFYYGKKELGTLNERLKELESQVAIFLYGHRDEEIKKSIIDYEIIKLKEEEEEKNFEIILYEKEIMRMNGEQLAMVVGSPAFKDRELTKQDWQNLIDETRTTIDHKILPRIKLLRDQKNKIGSQTEIEVESNKLIYLKKSIKENIKIVFIDDQANDGWSEIFKIMIYDKEKFNPDLFLTFSPKKKELDDIKSYYQDQIKEKLNDTDVVLLDLRLGKEIGTDEDVKAFSGSKLLEEIRNDFRDLPIMMVTASNKFWSYKQLQQNGADIIWSKEGLDKHSSTIQAVKNYARFLEMIKILTNNNYSLLRKISSQIKTLSERKFWWETQGVPKSRILNILSDSILLFREYCKQDIENNKFILHKNQWVYPSMIIQNTGKILEIIKIGSNKDTFYLLKYIRNWASHYEQEVLNKNITQLNIFIAKNYLQTILNYLEDEKYWLSPLEKSKYFKI